MTWLLTVIMKWVGLIFLVCNFHIILFSKTNFNFYHFSTVIMSFQLYLLNIFMVSSLHGYVIIFINLLLYMLISYFSFFFEHIVPPLTSKRGCFFLAGICLGIG